MTAPKRSSKKIIDGMYLLLLFRKKLRQLGDEVVAVDDAIISRTSVRTNGLNITKDYRIEHLEGWRCVVEEMQYGNASPRTHIRRIYPADEVTAEVVSAWIRRQGEAPYEALP